jgi:2-polyprenyl-3-methyl-5-hydroxy-6-metoxy-1,4-benzoquinol methylase
MKTSEFQKRVFEEIPTRVHQGVNDIDILSIIYSIIRDKINEKKAFINILDVGCGVGPLLKHLTKFSQVNVYGVDISEKAVKAARRVGYNAFRCNVETEKLPFNANFFDIIVVNNVLEHLNEPDKSLREIHRTMKENGKFILCVPNVSHPTSWFMQIFLDLPPMASARYRSVHVRDYTPRILKCVLKLNGFKPKQIKGTYIYPFSNVIGRRLAHLFPRLSAEVILICEKGVIPNLKLDDIYLNVNELLHICETCEKKNLSKKWEKI